MKKVIIIIGLALLMVGCNSPLKKSVTEELTTEELKSICDRNPSFLKFYQEFFETPCYQSFLSVKTDQVAFAGVTYKELYDYYCQISNEDYVNSVNIEAEKEWNDKFGYTEKKFDSIIGYWQNYYTGNSPETFLDIEFDHASHDETWAFVEENYHVNLYFKLTPKRDASIKDVMFDLAVKPYDDKTKVQLFAQSIGYNKVFSDQIVVDYRYNFILENELYKDLFENKLTNEELNEKYEFEYRIKYVKTEKEGLVDEDEIFKEAPEVGSYLKMLNWEEDRLSSKDRLLSYSKQSIVREYIDTNYEALDLFKMRYFDEKTKVLNPTCHDFFNYLKQCELLKTNVSNDYEFVF